MPTFDIIALLPRVLVAATVVELAALGALAWLLGRAGAERQAAESAVEALRADLTRLLEDAEGRARALEDALAAREASLRALLGRVGRVEQAAEARPERQHAGAPALGMLARGRRREDEDDPAEARLLRDLDLSLGRGRTA
ncbi:MAG TPA: hypothetical protein VKW76_11030 [Candidatus Binatia bacterium]|nr:hypothetical protein [Candidatus Binatia bacterium]